MIRRRFDRAEIDPLELNSSKPSKQKREQLMQAHGVLTCLYEVLLHAEDDDAVSRAQAARAAVCLIDRTVECLDSARLKPMLDAMESWVAEYGDAVNESQLGHWQ